MGKRTLPRVRIDRIEHARVGSNILYCISVDTTTPAAPSLGGGLFGAKPAAAAATATTAPLTTPAGPTAGPTAVVAIPPSALRGKSVEEIVNKWQEELETQTKEFKRTAQEIEVWDRTLIENSVQVGGQAYRSESVNSRELSVIDIEPVQRCTSRRSCATRN
jgi:nuclear pore complex protein Nup62